MVKALLAGLVLMVPLVSLSGEIRLHPEAHVEFSEGIPVVAVKITNGGDEPVRLNAAAGQWQGVTSRLLLTNTIVPGEDVSLKLLFPKRLSRSAGEPVVIRLNYSHANGNAFSALALAMDSPESEQPWLVASIGPATVGRSGNISLQLLLMEDESAEVVVRLILPDELGSGSCERKVRLEPDTQQVEQFELTNRSAVPGSVHTVFAVVERYQSGRHSYTTATGAVTILKVVWLGQSSLFWLGLAGLLLLALLGLKQWQPRVASVSPGLDAVLLAFLSGFIIWQLAPGDLIRNTTPVGGDTPAHLYLVSHLKEQLFHHGRVISWAGGWWCGFPMFQYYFPLPYAVGALLSLVIPLNVAFKLISVLGMVATPLSAYWAAREWRVSGHGPILLAVAMVPFLFVQSHVMWGVNTASTLAGMIANSWSFALLLPALALGTRDILDGRIRWRTILLFVLVLASHFFTSVVMFMTLAVVPLLAPFKRGLKVLVVESGSALLIMGWWLVPLVVKSEFSMDFGENWELSLLRSFPPYLAGMLIFGAIPCVAGGRQILPVIWLLLWMLLGSVALFKWGYSLSPVFVNVRLWPFIFFSLMALGALGFGLLLDRMKRGTVVVCLLVPVVLGAVVLGDSPGGFSAPGLTRSWAKWNFGGLEDKPAAAVFRKFGALLPGTPGRLANDLCEENNQLGSSRVFELMPHLVGKPILEGGLVNSALGSMYAYYIQGETSPTCAGFPAIVTPTTFDFTRATRHLELFNVKHFIARSALAKQALKSMAEWRLVAREGEWELHELMTHQGRYVFIPPRLPHVVETARWKECSLQWLYTPQALDQFLIWKRPGMAAVHSGLISLDESVVWKALEALRQTNAPGLLVPGRPLELAGTQAISMESVEDGCIRFRTTAVGLPHIIKVSWFPNWKVRGASGIYCISPGFMCVFPDQPEVELYYGSTWSDIVGYAVTVLGLILVVVLVVLPKVRRAPPEG